MANIKTRLKLRYDSLEMWASKNPTLLDGEVAIAYLPPKGTGDAPAATSTAVLMKVGPGAFNSLPFTSALAADVYGWAKKTESEFITWVNQQIEHPDDTDLDTRYSFEIVDGNLVVKSTLYTLGIAGTPTTVATLDFVTPAELETELAKYYTKTDVDGLFTTLRAEIALPDGGFASKTEFDALKEKVEDEDGALARANSAYSLAETKSTVTASSTNGKLGLNGSDITVYDDTALANRVGTLEGKTDLGDFTNNAGYAKTTEVEAVAEDVTKINNELDTFGDIVTHNVAEFATAAQGTKADNAAVKTEVEAALELKANKSVVDAMYTNAKIDELLATKQNTIPANTYDTYGSAAAAESAAKGYADQKLLDFENAYIKADDNGTIDKLNEIAAWIGNDTAGATKIISDVATNAANIKTVGEDLDKVELQLNGIAAGDGAVKNAIDAAKSGAEATAAGALATARTEISAEIDGDVKAAIDAEVLRADGKYELDGAEERAIAAAKTETQNQISTLTTGTINPLVNRVKAIEDAPYATKAQVDTKLDANGWTTTATELSKDKVTLHSNGSIELGIDDYTTYSSSTSIRQDGIYQGHYDAGVNIFKFPGAPNFYGNSEDNTYTLATTADFNNWELGDGKLSWSQYSGDQEVSISFKDGISLANYNSSGEGDYTAITHESIKGIKYADIAVKNDITTAVEALDSSVAATAEADGKVSVLTGVTQADGKLTAKTEVTLGKLAKKDVITSTDFADEVFIFDCGDASDWA